ncbi:MAG: sulfatase-like hydrolase/transferase [Candidatus Heimdallarchaeaceae archaeon]
MKKYILNFMIILMIFVAASGLSLSSSEITFTSSVVINAEPTEPYFDNVVLFTWDGTNAEWFSKLVHNGTLVNSQRVLENGFEQLVRVTTQSVSTNPCLSTLETGYSPEIHTVTRNVFGPGSEKLMIPDGLTTFERLKATFGSEVQIASFFPWGNMQFDYTYINLDPTHWDPIFTNVDKGIDVDYWFSSENLTWIPYDPETVSATLRPYNEALGKYPHYLLNADFLGNKAADWVTNHTSERFYLRIHVTEPDQAAGYGVTTTEWSGKITTEYMESLVISDRAVGAVYDVLEAAGVLDRTLFIIGADHGLYYKSHGGAPWPAPDWARSEMTFIFSNTSAQHSLGKIPITEKSISPTVLAAMGVDLSSIYPAYVGDDQTGVPLWEFSDTELPTIKTISYQTEDGEWETLTDGSKIGKVFNISMNFFDWCTENNATLEIDGAVFEENTSSSKNIKWYNVDTSSLSGGSKTLLFTLTDTFGNTATLEINNIKTVSNSMWISISGFLVLGSIIYLRKRKK